MKRNSRIREEGQIFAAALLMDLFFIATSQAATDLVVFAGKFTLTDQVEWGKTILQPGDYTVTVASGSTPILALVRDSKGRPVGRLVTATDYGKLELGCLGA